MDRAWIKGVLIVSFVVSLLFVFAGALTVLREPKPAAFEPPVPAPVPPARLVLPEIKSYADPAAVGKQIEQMNLQVTAYGLAVKTYEANVAAYTKDVEARTTAWKAERGDPSHRLTAYSTVVKDTIGNLIVAPLLAALVLYSGIKVAGDVAVAKAGGGMSVKAP